MSAFNKPITLLQNSTGETTSVTLIRYKTYLKKKEFFDKFRNPKNFDEIMNGTYLITNAPDNFWDKWIYDELISVGKRWKDWEVIHPIKIRDNDIIHYSNSFHEPDPIVKKLTFTEMTNYEKVKKIRDKHDIYLIINTENNLHLKKDTLYDSMNHCYVGKRFTHKDTDYLILDIEQKFLNKIKNKWESFVKDTRFTYLTAKHQISKFLNI